jgi:hypothetical protein
VFLYKVRDIILNAYLGKKFDVALFPFILYNVALTVIHCAQDSTARRVILKARQILAFVIDCLTVL